MLVLKTDYRIGGKPRYLLLEENDNSHMQVPDEIKKCVCFVGCRKGNNIVWGGTAFFVGIPVEGFPERHFNYLVTAKHCIDAIKTHSTDQKVLLRLNLPSGGTQIIETSVDDWRFHPTEASSVDVAVLQWNPEGYDILMIPSESMIASEEMMKEQEVGIGDEVFITGLFRLHQGTQRNLPILRTGNIARMPEEKIPVKMLDGVSVNIDAYLIEARSIGGLSGSPAFLYLGIIRNIGGSMKFVQGAKGGAFHWLGLVHGHWDIPEGTVDAIMDSDGNQTENKSVNVGISIIVPAQKVLEVINQEEYMNARKQHEEELQKENAPTLDTGITEEEFKKTLEKVSRKIKPSELDPSKPKT